MVVRNVGVWSCAPRASTAASISSVRMVSPGVSGQGLSVEREEAAPRLLRLRLVVDAGVGRAPAVRRAGVDLDLRRTIRLGEGVFQDVFFGRRPLIVVGGGVIGTEYACMLAAAGVKVTLV